MADEDFTTDQRMTSFSSAPGREERRHITGWMVLGFMLAFFAIIIGVNVFMAHAAISTFGGVETARSYHAGKMFERDVAMAKAQDAQHWQGDAGVSRAAGGTMLLDI